MEAHSPTDTPVDEHVVMHSTTPDMPIAAIPHQFSGEGEEISGGRGPQPTDVIDAGDVDTSTVAVTATSPDNIASESIGVASFAVRVPVYFSVIG